MPLLLSYESTFQKCIKHSNFRHVLSILSLIFALGKELYMQQFVLTSFLVILFNCLFRVVFLLEWAGQRNYILGFRKEESNYWFAPGKFFNSFILIRRNLTIKKRYLKKFHSMKTWIYFDFYSYLRQNKGRNIGMDDSGEISTCIHL